MISTRDLRVTQNKVRNFHQLDAMVKFIQEGGFFSREALVQHSAADTHFPLIEISKFEDGDLYIHDGHHRAASIVLGGREYLDPIEYRIREFKYVDYLEPNLNVEWWTPFDPRLEVRLPDFYVYKQSVSDLINGAATSDEIIEYIAENRRTYAEPHNSILTLLDFVSSIGYVSSNAE